MAPTAATPVLFLCADTGGGHRAAAQAVAEGLRRNYPARFAPVLLDPLAGPSSSWPLRRIMRLYGPAIRHAPWLWRAAYRATDSRVAMRVLRRTLLRPADGPVMDAVSALRPAVLVSFHALATGAAIAAAGRGPRPVPVVTVVTDLTAVHAAWRDGRADRIVVPSAAVGRRCRRGGIAAARCAELGLPVAAQFWADPLPPGERAPLRRALGVSDHRFLVVVTGGGEGAGGIFRSVSALLKGSDDVDVVAICGRNEHARRKLARLGGRAAGRLTVRGFVTNMADWMRCADILVTKAGPGSIAEAACCGAAMVLTSYLPGQETGNTELVLSAGAGRYAPRPADLVREIDGLRRDPAALAAMRAASARLGRPGAAAAIAALLAELTGDPPRPERSAVESEGFMGGQLAGNRLAEEQLAGGRGHGPA